MTFFPVIVPRESFSLARQIVVAAFQHKLTFDDAWVRANQLSHVDLIGKASLLLRPELLSTVSCPPLHATNATSQSNACLDLYRDVEHLKHPIKGAHSRPQHERDSRKLAETAHALLAAGEAVTTHGAPLPMRLFHYDRPRAPVLLQRISQERYAGNETCE